MRIFHRKNYDHGLSVSKKLSAESLAYRHKKIGLCNFCHFQLLLENRECESQILKAGQKFPKAFECAV
jgi:hypothetical protein